MGDSGKPEKGDQLSQLKQQIKNVAAVLGYGQKGPHAGPQEAGPSDSMAAGGQHDKKGEEKPGDEVKQDDSDELGDFLSKFFLEFSFVCHLIFLQESVSYSRV